MMSRSIGENFKKSYFIFFELSPFEDLDFEVFLEYFIFYELSPFEDLDFENL